MQAGQRQDVVESTIDEAGLAGHWVYSYGLCSYGLESTIDEAGLAGHWVPYLNARATRTSIFTSTHMPIHMRAPTCGTDMAITIYAITI